MIAQQSRVELAAFGGTTATWTFTHTSTAIERQSFHPPACDTRSAALTVPLLTRVTLPDGSFYEMSYETSDFLTQSGAITSLRLPTGGELRWSYQGIDFLSQDPELNGPEHARTAYGVASKEIFEEAGNAASKEGEWSYAYTTVTNPSMPGESGMVVPCFHTTEVTDPLGNATVHYFDTASLNRWQYGLPFRRCNGDGTLSSSPYLSQEVYDGSASTGTRLRSVYVAYDSDGRDGGSHQEKNHRLRLRRVEYEDDPGRFREVSFADFDGLGQFRESTTTGNFTSGGESRTVVTSYSPGSGTLLLDPDDSSPLAGNDFAMPGRNDPWVLGTFTRRDVTEGVDTATSEFCFDGDTGFLERQRVWAGVSRQPADVVTVFTEETSGGQGTGRVAREEVYGGDPGGLGTGGLCNLNLPEPQRRLEHAYAFGSLESSRFLDPCDGSEVLRVADLTIDRDTGLVATARDSAGVATTFTYDGLGRQTGDRPPSSAWTVWEYELPTLAEPDQVPRVTVSQCPSGQVSCTPLGWQRASFDGNLVEITVGGVTSRYDYDPLNTMKSLQTTTDQARVFIYDADDERILTFDCALVACATQEAKVTATVRDLDGKVLRVYTLPFDGKWTWDRDYVYRDGQLLATVEPASGGGESTRHFHLDHLGSPRQVTDASAQEVAFHAYYPFGGEATSPSQDGVALKFTGHERDANGTGSGLLDYMHARYYSPELGRFLSVDPVVNANLAAQQGWNRYSYVRNNPILLTDPRGEAPVLALVALIAVGGIVFGPSAANTPESPEVELIPSRGVPLDVMTVEAALGPVAGFLGRLGKRIFGPLFRKSGREVVKKASNRTLGDILLGARRTNPGRLRQGRAAQFERPGGFQQANADFNALRLRSVVDKGGGVRVGKMPDGRTVIVRPTSLEGSPTLEIQGGLNPIKIRFN